MKRNILTLTMLVVYSISAFSSPRDIVIEEQEQKCYVCGRSVQDFSHIHDEVISQLGKQLIQAKRELEVLLQNRRQTYERITESTRNNPNMSLTVQTIKTDVESFKEIIPYVTELIDFYDRYENQLSLGSSSRLKLIDLLSAMGTKDTPEIISKRKEIEFLEHSLNHYEELQDSILSFELFKLTTKLSYINPDLSNPERTRANSPVSPFDLALRLRRDWESSKKEESIQSVLDTAWQTIRNDARTRDEDRALKFEQFKAYFFNFHDIDYSIYICPICLTLLKHGPKSSQYRLFRFDTDRDRWDSQVNNYP